MSRVRHTPNIIVIIIAARIIWRQIQSRRSMPDTAGETTDSPGEPPLGGVASAAKGLGRGVSAAKQVVTDAVSVVRSTRPAGSETGMDRGESSTSSEPDLRSTVPPVSSSGADVASAVATPAPSLEAEIIASRPDPIASPAVPASAAEAAITKTKARPRRRGGPVPPGAVASDGSANCPDDYPIKGNASSMIYHQPGQPSYNRTIPEYCFAHEDDARGAGYRPPKR